MTSIKYMYTVTTAILFSFKYAIPPFLNYVFIYLPRIIWLFFPLMQLSAIFCCSSLRQNWLVIVIAVCAALNLKHRCSTLYQYDKVSKKKKSTLQTTA